MDPTVFAQLLVFSLLIGSLYGLVALGLTMIWGVMNVFNLAHGAMMVVGMYTVWWTTTAIGVPPYLGLPVAVAVLFVLGVGMYVSTIAPIMDGPENKQLIVTLGWLLILVALVQLLFSPEPRRIETDLGAIEIAGVFVPLPQLIALVIALAAVGGMIGLLYYTAIGRAIRATADNRESAHYVGLNIRRIDAVTFGIGASLAGVAGGAIATIQRFDPYLGDVYLVFAFIVVVLGGLGSFKGAIVGGIIIGLLQVFGSFYLPGSTYRILLFLVFICLLLFRPTGIFGVSQNA